MSIPNQPVEATDPLPSEQTVRRFYDAINVQIRTGDPSALLDVLHGDFSDEHPLPGFAPEAEGLVEHIAALRTSTPSVEIAVESVVARGEEVLAVVSIDDGAQIANGTGFESSSPVWSPRERFRIEGSRIIERSSANRDLIVVQERFDLPLTLDANLQAAYLATHWTFAASASTRFQTSGGPAALHVLSGELAITVTSDASASGMDAPAVLEPDSERSNPVPIDDVLTLPQGSTLTLP